MGAFDFSAITSNQRELEDIGGIVVELAYTNPTLEAMHDVQTGIDMQTQILLLGAAPLVGLAATGCKQVSQTAQSVFSSKFWEKNDISIPLEFCRDDIPALFKAFGRQSNDFDISGTPEVALFVTQIVQAIEETNLRLVWFGDKDADTIANSGMIATAEAVPFFTPVNGLWKQIFAAVTAGNVQRHTITQNAGADFAAQVLPDNAASGILRNVYNQSDSRLKNDPNGIFIVTQSVFDNYSDELERSGLSAVGNIELNNGVMTYKNRPIIVADFMDRIISAHQNTGIREIDPHRVVFTNINNIPVGTLDTAELNDVRVHYDETDETVYARSRYSIDAKLLEEYRISVAY